MRQLTDQILLAFYDGLGIRHVISSIEHPQTNGQAEAADKIIFEIIKEAARCC